MPNSDCMSNCPPWQYISAYVSDSEILKVQACADCPFAFRLVF